MIRRSALAALVTAGCGGVLALPVVCHGREGSAPHRAAQPSAPARLVGITVREFANGRFEVFVSRLGPSTLAVQGRRAAVGEFHDTWSLSPDGRFVALGTGGQGLGIKIYDLDRGKRVRAIRTGIAAQGLAWVAPDRLLAILQSNRLVVVNPSSGRVLRERSIPRGQTGCTSSRTGSSSRLAAHGLLVLLRARAQGPAQLLHADADGRVRSLALPRGPEWGCGRAGLVTDPAGDRAYVVSRGSSVAEVDIATMTARHHTVGGLRAAARREVSWLDGGKLVSSGRPAGVSVIDTASWNNLALDTRAAVATAAGELVLAYDGDAVALPKRRRTGVTAYTADGRKVFQVLDGTQINDVQVAGTRAYAISERAVHAIDLASGRVVGERTSDAARISVTLLRRSDGSLSRQWTSGPFAVRGRRITGGGRALFNGRARSVLPLLATAAHVPLGGRRVERRARADRGAAGA